MIKNIYNIDNFKTLIYALIIALIIRSLLIQPFYIPSSSMELNLLVGDRLFVTKYTYGYSKHSFPFSPPIFKNRIFENYQIEEILLFLKHHMTIEQIILKDLLDLPGDTIQFIDGDLYINNNQVLTTLIKIIKKLYCGNQKFMFQLMKKNYQIINHILHLIEMMFHFKIRINMLSQKSLFFLRRQQRLFKR